jgi:hypothetical protein
MHDAHPLWTPAVPSALMPKGSRRPGPGEEQSPMAIFALHRRHRIEYPMPCPRTAKDNLHDRTAFQTRGDSPGSGRCDRRALRLSNGCANSPSTPLSPRRLRGLRALDRGQRQQLWARRVFQARRHPRRVCAASPLLRQRAEQHASAQGGGLRLLASQGPLAGLPQPERRARCPSGARVSHGEGRVL